jgi:hypothetical protein
VNKLKDLSSTCSEQSGVVRTSYVRQCAYSTSTYVQDVLVWRVSDKALFVVSRLRDIFLSLFLSLHNLEI